jgi:hypothetical protein
MFLAIAVAALLPASSFEHVPPGSAVEGEPLRLTGRMQRDARVVVHYRAAGGREGAPTYEASDVLRTREGEFVLELPAARVAPPGLEYYVSADDQPVFATPEDPYFVTVVSPDEARWSAAALRAHESHRSLARVRGEWVDFGSRTVAGHDGELDDHYWRLEGDYAYSLYRTIYTIRIGGGVLRSSTFIGASAEPVDPGLDYGFAEVRWRLGESVFLDTRGLLGADKTGFQPGGAATLLLGKPEGVYVALGGEVTGRAGEEGFLALHWDTIRAVPMTARVALSDFPSSERPTGVRLGFDASHAFGPLTLTAQLGYQARDIHAGGLTFGLGAEHAF